MQSYLKDIHREEAGYWPVLKEELSCEPFFNYLDNIVQTSDPHKRLLPEFALKRIREVEHKRGKLSLDNMAAYDEVFHLIYNLTVSLMANNQDTLWGIGLPASKTVAYGTDALYSFLDRNLKEEDRQETAFIVPEIDPQIRHLYALVLQRFYGFPNTEKDKILYTLKNEDGSVNSYYDLITDYTFVDIQVKGDLPAIDYRQLKEQRNPANTDWSQLSKVLDITKFEFSGFTLLTFQDVTEERVTQHIKSMMTNLSLYETNHYFQKLDQFIKILLGVSEVQFSLFPLFHLNGSPVVNSDFTHKSVLFGQLQNIFREESPNFIYEYLHSPFSIVYNLVDGMIDSESMLTSALQQIGINSYLGLPLYYNNTLSGVLEIYSTNGKMLDKSILPRLRHIATLLSQLSFDLSLEFKNRLDKVITEQFTALQPAVQWKFNQVAAKYLGDLAANVPNSKIQDIYFRDVYPLYGAIDVRDSSVLRSKAVQRDFNLQHQQLEELLLKIQNIDDSPAVSAFMDKMRQSGKLFSIMPFDEALLKIVEFFRKDLNQFFEEVRHHSAETDALISSYENQISCNEIHNDCFQNEFEISLQQLNAVISQELDVLNAFVQGNYPSYFEKFRTDGIEYDIFVGESITPLQPFDPQIIRIFRLQQLITMARIGILVHHMQPQLKIPLQTTQLIFVNPTNIDISFRSDERRFDVEGSYNIRYQIIKKRIDKIRIRHSLERLTQPDKIAIVYFSQEMASELRESIQSLQATHLLLPGIEELDLEEVQGVEGLRAMRVGINPDSPVKK